MFILIAFPNSLGFEDTKHLSSWFECITEINQVFNI